MASVKSKGVIVSIDGERLLKKLKIGIERYNLTKSGRVASGKMTMEIVAKKTKLLTSAEVMSGPELDQLIRLVYGDKSFFPVLFLENGRERTIMAYSGAVKYEEFRTDGVWYWKNVTVDLIEQ